LLVVSAKAGERCPLYRTDTLCRRLKNLEPAPGRTEEDHPLILGSALEQATGLEAENSDMHRLSRDLSDARQFGSSELGPGLKHAENYIFLRGQLRRLQGFFEQVPKTLVGEAEQVTQVGLGSWPMFQRLCHASDLSRLSVRLTTRDERSVLAPDVGPTVQAFGGSRIHRPRH